jgi:hypothetical protein
MATAKSDKSKKSTAAKSTQNLRVKKGAADKVKGGFAGAPSL